MSARSLQAKRASARGYTSVEVLMAMTLFAIGAAGVIGMQRVTIQGGEDARRFDMATNIANEWLSRLQKDASFWRTEPDLSKPDTMGFNTTTWLKNIDACGNQFCTIPMPPGPTFEGLSPAFDVFGRDLPTGTDGCVLLRPVPTHLDRCAGCAALQQAAQARARSCAPRSVSSGTGSRRNPSRTARRRPPEVIPANPTYHMVYAATSLREGPPR